MRHCSLSLSQHNKQALKILMQSLIIFATVPTFVFLIVFPLNCHYLCQFPLEAIIYLFMKYERQDSRDEGIGLFVADRPQIRD